MMQVPRRTFSMGVVLCLLVALPARAQDALTPASPEDALKTVQQAEEQKEAAAELEALASPRATMNTFLQAMDRLWEDPRNAWDDAATTLDVAPDDETSSHEYARRLYGVLGRVGEVDLDDLPDETEVHKEKLQDHRYFPNRVTQSHVLKRLRSPPSGSITLSVDETGRWRFDRQTMNNLPRLYKQMEPLPLISGKHILTVSDYIRNILPRSLTESAFLTLAYWQWMAIGLLVFAGLVIDLLIRLVLRRIEPHLKTEDARTDLRRGMRPIGRTGALLLWWITLQFLEIEGTIGDILRATLTILLALASTVSAWRVTDLVGEKLVERAKQSRGNIDDVLVPLVVRAIKVLIVVVAIVFAASALDVPLTPLLASITIAGVAFSFAAKDTVENFFGSVAVLLDRPFDLGDWVVIDDTEGMVEQVGFRSTRVRTFYNSLVTIPNANLVRAVVDNYGRRRYRRWRTMLGVQYDTTPDQLVSFTEGIRELVRLHPYTRKDYYEVYCNEFGDSSLNILLYVFFDVPDWNTELRERERMFLDIVRLADQLGVQFAFPTQTVHLFQGQPADQPANEIPDQSDERRRNLEGIRTAQRLVRNQPWTRQKPPPVQITTQRTEVPLDDAGNPVIEEDKET